MGLFERLRARFWAWLRRLMTERRRIRDVDVVIENMARPDIQNDDVAERLDEALALIEKHQPWRLNHLRRDVAAIWIVRWPTRGAYFPRQRMCMVELTFLARRDISAAVVAACIIHEGAHARVSRMQGRLGGMAAINRAREERLCRRAEISFASMLPPEIAAPILERASEALELEDEGVAPKVDWNVAMARQRMLDIEAGPLPGAVKRRLIAKEQARIDNA